MNFLVVDDSYDDRLATRRYLRQAFGEKISIRQASDPKEALSLVSEHEFDCILLDLHYQGDSGYSLLESIRDVKGEVPAAVIVMTGSGSEEAAVACLKLGAHDYVTKPKLNGPTLHKAVNTALDSYRIRKNILSRQDELERINQELKLKDTLKTNFVASASHELRTPVAAILALLELLEKTDLDQAQTQIVEDLRSCSDTLLLTVDDVIDLARVEAGIMETRPYPFNIHDELQESLRPLRVLARDKNLTLESHIPDNLVLWRIGDRRRIRQILNNLVGNAIKYTETGEVTIRLQEGQDNMVIFSVSDTGIGISPEDQDRIFEPFFQANVDDDVAPKSSGLGLTTCVNLVKALQGTLELDSVLGGGSTFRFSIPLPPTEPPTLTTESENRPKDSDRKVQRLHVLLAEDNKIISNVLQAQLESRNYTVTCASDGAKALEILKRDKVDVVLMDCQMPNMDGYEATEKLRNELELSVPVIALTADAFQSQRDRCLECGMNDILVKPVSAKELDEYLTKLGNT